LYFSQVPNVSVLQYGSKGIVTRIQENVDWVWGQQKRGWDMNTKKGGKPVKLLV